MSFERMKAILYQEYYITIHALEVIFDLLFFSLITTVTFGFFTSYNLLFNPQTGQFLFMGVLLMEIVRITQYTTSLNALWNIWSRNLTNLFISPLSAKEYLLSQMASGAIKALGIFILITLIAKFFFNFDIYKLGLINISLFYINLVIFSWSAGIAILGFIFKFGSRYSALAWSIVFLFQPLMGVYYPIKILPQALQAIAYALPPSYIFEAARGSWISGGINWQFIGVSFVMNVVYFILSLWFFNAMFKKSKETGQFARNEG